MDFEKWTFGKKWTSENGLHEKNGLPKMDHQKKWTSKNGLPKKMDFEKWTSEKKWTSKNGLPKKNGPSKKKDGVAFITLRK